MRLLLFILFYAWGQVACSQDSVKLKITRIATADGKHVIWMKDVATKDRYITQCPCKVLPAEYKKGNIITLPVTKMEVIREVFRKQDLEN